MFLLFFDQINAALVSIRDLFHRHYKNSYHLTISAVRAVEATEHAMSLECLGSAVLSSNLFLDRLAGIHTQCVCVRVCTLCIFIHLITQRPNRVYDYFFCFTRSSSALELLDVSR